MTSHDWTKFTNLKILSKNFWRGLNLSVSELSTTYYVMIRNGPKLWKVTIQDKVLRGEERGGLGEIKRGVTQYVEAPLDN